MKVLVLGQGGREHALVKAFRHSPSVTEIHAIPGHDGMAHEALCHRYSMTDSEAIIQFCLRTEIDFVFIGPEDPLVQGIADDLRARGVLVIGPSRDAALLEGSKIFAKQFMRDAQVPTAAFEIVQSVESTLTAAKKFSPPYILKADGLAAGKGVYICQNLDELGKAAHQLFVEKILGTAGERAVLEENLPGWELSYLVITDGLRFEALPLAQDHKRLKDLHQGPNTGGMGTVAPLKIDPSLDQQIREKIIAPTVATIQSKGFTYRGVLFVGVMVTSDGPKTLEYNVRLGDPETQVILPLLENDLGQLFLDLAKGMLRPLSLKNLYSCCVILAAEGYPDKPIKGVSIEGDLSYETVSSYFIHAGTQKDGHGIWRTNGGRVLGAVGIGSSAKEASENAYSQASKVRWPGLQMRQDIGRYI
jgi:phosphoribosylamine--glycine ligase